MWAGAETVWPFAARQSRTTGDRCFTLVQEEPRGNPVREMPLKTSRPGPPLCEEKFVSLGWPSS